MSKDYIAVAVGYHFGLIPSWELEGTQIVPIDSSVYLEGQSWNLFKGKTFADSRKIDALLDEYGEHAIRDYKIEPVIMSGELEMVVPGFDETRDSLLLGGYAFICDGKEIPFDFSGISWDIRQEGDKLSVPFSTGRTPLSKDYFLDDCYEDEYTRVGLRIHDIKASFLSKASSISEFAVSLELDGEEYGVDEIRKFGHFAIKSLIFSDGNQEYPVSQAVLDTYNAGTIKDKESTLSERISSAEQRSSAHESTKSDIHLPEEPER